MENVKKNITIFASLFILLILLTSGCAKKAISLKQGPIRYQDIEIPGYSKGDYEKLLTSKDYEVRYNAICNLIQYADDYGRLLSKRPDNDAISVQDPKNRSDIKNAEQVFKQILIQLNNPNESLKAASLIFLTEFASTYSEKAELIDLVLNIKTKDIGTKYEQLNALNELSDSTTIIDSALLYDFLDSGSWIIKSKTYALLSGIDSENVHKRLIDEYMASVNEFDKILIINAFSKSFGDEVFNLLTNELKKGPSKIIKKFCASIIKNNRSDAEVIKWLIENYRFVGDDILITVINSYIGELDKQKGQVFFRNLLLSGQEKLIHAVNREEFFNGLYNALKEQSGSNALSEVKASIYNIESLRSSWIVYKSKFEKQESIKEETEQREELFEKNILPKFNEMLESFLKESEQLFTDEGLTQEEVKEATASLRELLKFLKKEKDQ